MLELMHSNVVSWQRNVNVVEAMRALAGPSQLQKLAKLPAWGAAET